MSMSKLSIPVSISGLVLIASALSAQVRTPPPPPTPTAVRADQATDDQPIFRVTVVERTTNAVSYRHRSGWTKVDLHGTPLAPDATGHADVNSRPGYIEAKAEMHQPAAGLAVRSRIYDLCTVGHHS